MTLLIIFPKTLFLWLTSKPPRILVLSAYTLWLFIANTNPAFNADSYTKLINSIFLFLTNAFNLELMICAWANDPEFELITTASFFVFEGKRDNKFST